MRTITLVLLLMLSAPSWADNAGLTQTTPGRIYGSDGSYEGRVYSSGRLYDNQGDYEDRIEKQ